MTMTSSFELTLYLSQQHHYNFRYPIDSNKQSMDLGIQLGLTTDEFVSWKPNWQHLPMYHKDDFLKCLSNPFSYITETHVCREVAMSKGEFYDNWQAGMGMLFRKSYVTLTYPHQIPRPFHDIVTSALLIPHGVNSESQNTLCNLESREFGIGMHPGYWNKAWLSLLTYFAKYGEFLWENSGVSYDGQFSLDQTVTAILNSWSGQVGFYTAYGLWLWSNRNDATSGNYNPFNGIHSAMDHFSALYKPNSLLEFIVEYELDLSRVSRLYLNNHRERCTSLGLTIPDWYTYGSDNDDYLAESPEWNEYMGYDDEDMDDYREESDYDFEEDGW
jgi:hypothetical protein